MPGAEAPTAALLEAREFDYVVGSVHFIGEGDSAVDPRLIAGLVYTLWTGNAPETLAEAWRPTADTTGKALPHGLGWFVELETITDETGRDAARECLFELSRELGLGKSERRSYLRLLLGDDPHER